MKYGITWFVGDGEHDYEEAGRQEYGTLRELLLDGLLAGGAAFGPELLFEALVGGCQDTIYWITDDFGFAFYRATQPQRHVPGTE